MRVIVLQPFRDKDNFLKEYHEGDILDVDDVRGATLVERKLAKEEAASTDAAESDAVEKEVKKRRKKTEV